MEALKTPTAWPHVVIERGPPSAGVQAGDAIAFAPRELVTCQAHRWGSRACLSVGAAHDDDGAHVDPDEDKRWICHRVLTEPLRLEMRRTTHGDWFVDDAKPFAVGPWTLRFVLDGAPLATVKRFGPHLAAHCTAVGRASRLHGEHESLDERFSVYSEWLLPANGAARSLLVIERASGEVVYRLRPRRTGLDLSRIEALTMGVSLSAALLSSDLDPVGGARVAPEVAAGIAMQADDDQSGVAFVGWDGVLRHVDDVRGPFQYGCRARIFARLMRLKDLDVAKAQLAATRAVSVADVGAFVRALDPDAAARDAALVEECGVLAG